MKIEDIKKTRKLIKEKLNENKKDIIKVALILTIVYVIAIMPLIRANYNYADDIGRVEYGGPKWNNFSRFGSTALSYLLHGGSYLVDISPLPQFLAIIILIMSSIILIKVISDENKDIIWKIIAVIPLGLSPYFLECLSYKYDSIYMALSILVSVVPFLFYKRKKILFYFITIISVLAMCLTYQASSGVYLMLTILLCLKMWNNNEKYKNIGIFLLTALGGFLTGIIIFKLFIMVPINAGYVSNYVFPLDELFKGVCNNLFEYFKVLYCDYSLKWKILFLIINISFIITSIIKSQRNKIGSCIVSIVAILMMLLTSSGLYPFLEKLSLSARAIYGIGVYTAMVTVYAVDYKKAYIPKIATVILSYLCIIFCMTYGNALAEQKRYTDYRIEQAINDINNIEIIQNDKVKKLKIVGEIGKSKIIRNMNDNLLNKLVRSFRGDWYWSKVYFFGYFDLEDKNIIYTNIIKNENELTLAKKTLLHDIYVENDDYILLKFK